MKLIQETCFLYTLWIGPRVAVSSIGGSRLNRNLSMMKSISVGDIWVGMANEGNQPSAVLGLYGAGDDERDGACLSG